MMNSFEEKIVQLFGKSNTLSASLRWGKLDESKMITELLFEGKIYSGSGRDYFEAIQSLRMKLCLIDFKIGLVGARRDFYPSNMSRQMSEGQVGYLLEFGKQATLKAKTFDACEDINLLADVDEQNLYFKEWLSSL